MKGKDSSDLQNELSATANPSTEASLDTLSGDIDVEARSDEWARFCLRHRAVEETSEIACARVELPQIDGLMEVRIAASFSGGKQMNCTLFIVPLGDIDPLPVTSCHMGENLTLRGGNCLLVPVSEDIKWAHDIWPKSMEELNAFVANVTDSPRFLEAWVMESSRESNKLLMVVVIHGNVCYGYLLGSPKTDGFNETRVIPIFFEQVGELTCDSPVLIELELSVKSLEALLRHARQLLSEPDYTQEDRCLRDALGELANALEKGGQSISSDLR
ncbi:hypothetical protein CYD26_21435 [Pseudomonas sp. FFUP_PS_473]|uniref:hypothetical protein n=1 Tax=Pseudomonas sp. FFUP_PS_473 TaxID=2060418 RepID=UPI000C7E2D99|nr:hypothetical protein [Pseudomonas sp. FFUP_PS_473]PLP87464.1 hypothetical protein CYD26_21435 [Pseudomonas sp. FFUP_PS_473]